MKNRARTRFTFILSLILVSSALFSCGGETTEPSGTTSDDMTSEAVTSELSIEDQRKLIDDEASRTMDYGGEEINITVNSYCESGFFSDELSGDQLSDAIYNRNKAVEERFKIKFNFISGEYNEITQKVKSSVLAGDDQYQLLANHALASTRGLWREF